MIADWPVVVWLDLARDGARAVCVVLNRDYGLLGTTAREAQHQR